MNYVDTFFRFLLSVFIGGSLNSWSIAGVGSCSPARLFQDFTQHRPHELPIDTIIDHPPDHGQRAHDHISGVRPKTTIAEPNPESMGRASTGDYSEGLESAHHQPHPLIGAEPSSSAASSGVRPQQTQPLPDGSRPPTADLALIAQDPLEQVFSARSPELQLQRGQPMVARLGSHEWTGRLDFVHGHPVLIRSEPGALPQVIPPRAEIRRAPAGSASISSQRPEVAGSRSNNIDTLIDRLEKNLSSTRASGGEFSDLIYFRRQDGSIGSGYLRALTHRDGRDYVSVGATPARELSEAFVEDVPIGAITTDQQVIQNYRSGRSGGPRPRP